jgi:Zn-dependent protease
MTNQRVRVARILGIDIQIDASWIFIAALMIWSFATTAFPELLPGLSNATYLVMAIATTLGFFAALVVHELAHSIVSHRFGLPVNAITLFIFGGIAELSEDPRSPGSEFWIAVAGPLATLGIIGICALGAAVLAPYGQALALRVVLEHLVMMNLTVLVFNLVPALPLDGGRILRALLWRLSGDPLRSAMIASALGIGFAWILVVVGITALFSSGDAMGLWLVLIGMFMMAAAHAIRFDARLRRFLGGRTVSSVMTPCPVTTTPQAMLSDVVTQVMLPNGHAFLPVVQGEMLVGVVDAAAVRLVDREQWDTTPVSAIMEPPGPLNTVAPDASSDMVLQHMARTRRNKLMVVRDAKLVGVLSITDLLKYLSLLQAFNRGGSNTRLPGPSLNLRRAGRSVAPRNAAQEEVLKDIQRRISGHETLLRSGKHWQTP